METINTILSNDLGYLNALRHAPAVPPPAPLISPQLAINKSSKMKKMPTWVWIISAFGISVFAVYQWKLYHEKNKSKNF